ncbi:hypothetical protein AX17_001102 [Amanita inopinata Kibby_2008]|nr:hypothetical protein AX17_001102 [Amanita inopinata Kibby_2008]
MVKAANQVSPRISAPSSSFKRRKSEDEDTNGMVTKKQRTRVSFSCGECHRRKQKCDRQIPCSHCITRKVPDLCKAYTPGKADQDLSARIAKLERIIQIALPQYWSSIATLSPAAIHTPMDRGRSPSVADEDSRSQTEDHDPIGGTFQSGKWYGNSASGSVAPSSVLEQLKNVAGPPPGRIERDKIRRTTHDRDLKNIDLLQASNQTNMTNSLSLADSVDDDLESSAADNLKLLVQECGVSPHKISDLLEELPPPRTSDVLIDYYFSAINWTRYPVSERDFRAAYASVCSRGRDGIGTTNHNDVRFLPLLFVVLAIATRLAPENIAGDARTRRITSLRYYWSSRQSLLIAAAIQPDSLDIVLTRLLSARFLTFDRRITECWSQLGAAVRTAQALGLHRDGSKMGMDPSQVEYRRRIWSYLYHADRSYALVLGRPNSIQDDYTSTKLPSNIDDASSTACDSDNPPLSSPTPMTFVILRHHLAGIMGRIVHHFQRVRERSHYSEVIALDEELLNFANNLPPHFTLNPDRSLDETSRYIPVHRFLLITEIMFVRIGLHRPYLLRRLNSDRYARSRQACFESAIKDFEVRQAFRQTMPKEARGSLSNAYREFQTAMISGIYFVLEPKGPHTEAMRAILDGFMKDREGMREMDETTGRELGTIEFLRMKASQVENLESQYSTANPSSTMANPEQQAQLLLELQQSVPASTSQKHYSSILSAPPSEAASQPPMSFAAASHINRSGNSARLQYGSEHTNSPTTSGSPGTADDDTMAQSLLDHWCNTVSNVPLDVSTAAMTRGGPGGADFSGWIQPLNVNGADPRLLTGLDGSDWTYWEALVNEIHRGP